jgi:hypothetical protein
VHTPDLYSKDGTAAVAILPTLNLQVGMAAAMLAGSD